MINDNDSFGNTDSKKMPWHLFFGAVRLDHSTAVRADIGKQDYSVCPRHWYVDATFRCEACDQPFKWSAAEQRTWFEAYHFYVDSRPTRCPHCRAEQRQLKALQKEYDRTVASARSGASLDEKKIVVALIDQITEMAKVTPAKMLATRSSLLNQIRKAEAIRHANGIKAFLHWTRGISRHHVETE